MHFANEYALQDGLLQVLCVSQNGCVRRSDAFIFVLNGEVILLDSGLPEMHYALMKLLELRSVFLSKRESELENKEVKLKITWVVSHMHSDHIGAFLDHLAYSPYIYIEKAYLPPKTEYFDPILSPDWDGDYKYREKIAQIFYSVHPETEIIDIPFTSDKVFPVVFSSAFLTILPPVKDWGKGDLRDKSERLYVPFDSEKSLPISITNGNSLWVVLSYKDKKFVFTGDAMKKYDDEVENFDEMMENWKEYVKDTNVFKYPHHGMLRNPASIRISELNPDYVLCNAIDASAPKALKERGYEKQVINFGYEDKLFTVDNDGKMNLD